MLTPLFTIRRLILISASLALAGFLLTGVFDYLYIQQVLGSFQQGLETIQFLNPHLAKFLAALGGAALSALYIKLGGVSIGPMRRTVGFFTIAPLLMSALVHGVSAYGTWGDWFDDAGHSHLTYEITPENRVVFYSGRKVSPRTNRELHPVTADVVHELECRRRGDFHEIFNPKPDDWFAPGDGSPLLWYSEHEGFHFFNMPAHDGSSATLLKPVTPELHRRYYAEIRESEERTAEARRVAAEAAAAKVQRASVAPQTPSTTPSAPEPTRAFEPTGAGLPPTNGGPMNHLRTKRPSAAAPSTGIPASNVRIYDLRPGLMLNIRTSGRACRCWSNGPVEIAVDGGPWHRQVLGTLRFLPRGMIRARPLAPSATQLFLEHL